MNTRPHDSANRRLTAWTVRIGYKWIDTVYFVPDMDAEEVRKSLLDHDGYPGNITVKREDS